MSTRDAEDRREFYRIEDSIALEIQPLTAEEACSGEPLHDDSTLFNLLADLNALDYDSQQFVRAMTDRDRALAAYLKSMNKRIDLIGQVVAQHLLREIGPPQRVTLSEAGLGFIAPEPMPMDTLLALRIVLLPQAIGLLLKARIVHCQLLEDGQYELGTAFEDLLDTQRQLLARHVLQKQALARRLALQQAVVHE